MASGLSEADQLHYLGAAERALQIGKNPGGVFRQIVTKRLWDNINADQEARAKRRLDEYRKSTGPPSNGSPSASLAQSFKSPE